LNLKSRVIAAAAAVTLVGGGAAGALAATSAGAATPSCGSSCTDIFSHQFGTFRQPNFILDVFRQTARPGTPIILFRTSNSDPAEDFSAEFNGLASDFYAAGFVAPALAMRYGCTHGAIVSNGQQITCDHGAVDDPAFEIEYAPDGVNSGLCVGVAATASANEKVTLQGCGVSSRTVWIVDTADQAKITKAGVPLINGSDNNFSHPFVLTYPKNAYPTDIPRVSLTVSNLTGSTQPGGFLPVIGTINSGQLWSAAGGATGPSPVPSPVPHPSTSVSPTPTPTPTVTVPAGTASAVTKVTGDPDSGAHGYWASDAFTRTVSVTKGGAAALGNCPGTPAGGSCFHYTGSLSDAGTFTTLVGANSPNAGTLIKGQVTGTMNGGGEYSFYASNGTPNGSLVLTALNDGCTTGSTSSQCAVDAAAVAGADTVGGWVRQFFPLGTHFSGGSALVGTTWGWTYLTTSPCVSPAQQYVDAAAGVTGDILGALGC
jgi:hypothetical protein